MSERPKILIFVVAYNAARTIREVMTRIPADLGGEAEILIIDDASADDTFERARTLGAEHSLPHPVTVLFNPVNQGYGGNQKIGYHYALANGFDVVALVHGDGQYAPEELPRLLRPVVDGDADAVFGSRMMTRGAALAGGMPLYKYLGNSILSFVQNRLLGSRLSEFHSGYRVYSTGALRRIRYWCNTDDFHFDTQIIIQLMRAGQRIVELPIPTYYGDEICHVNGLKYAVDVVVTTARAALQRYGVLYDPAFEPAPEPSAAAEPAYAAKLDFPSPHSTALALIPPGARVMDVGCADGHVAAALKAKGCHVIGVDRRPPPDAAAFDAFLLHDLDNPALPAGIEAVDWVLLLDVIEHLRDPERFAAALHAALGRSRAARVVVSTGNVGFLPIRLMLLLGQFNYGQRGILDRTHTRLFTFGTLKRLLRNAGFAVERVEGVPAPFPLAFGDNRLSRALLVINALAIRLSARLFGYQMLMVCRPVTSLDWLLAQAMDASRRRGAAAPGRERHPPETANAG